MSRQINLLPKERRVRQGRMGIIHSAFSFLAILNFVIVVISAVALLTVTLLYISSLRLAEDSGGREVLQQFEELQDKQDEFSRRMKATLAFEQQHYRWATFIPNLVISLPDSVEVSSISALDSTLSLSGIITDRESLAETEEIIRSLPGVQEVSSPPSNLLVANNSPFKLDIIVKMGGEQHD